MCCGAPQPLARTVRSADPLAVLVGECFDQPVILQQHRAVLPGGH